MKAFYRFRKNLGFDKTQEEKSRGMRSRILARVHDLEVGHNED